MMKTTILWLLHSLVLLILMVSCKQQPGGKRFTNITAQSGIEFTNSFTETEEFNIFNFMNMYNGGGVAVGDFNGDGLADVFLTSNQQSDKLFLNKGNLEFEDVTEVAGVGGKKGWTTGANVADVNGDGLPDIYVCYSGLGDAAYRANELFINQGLKNGIPFFSEQAAEYGLDAPGTNSNQSVFFDYDRDGDLDMFLLNHATTFYSPFFNTHRLRTLRHPAFSHRFYRNDDGHFSDISESVGLKGGGNTFGLGVMASDVNNDGWPDLYMTNDFEEQDYLLLNNQDGTFSDITKKSFGHISRYGMGCDIADYNNDGLIDVFVADMLPEDNKRQKLLEGPDQYDKYNLLVDSGYFHQNMRNTFQVNQGNSAGGTPQFAEIGQLAGISNTDWSWAPLFADFDNDGYKDLFITNGYWRDFTNLDFSNYVVNDYQALNGNQRVGLEVMSQLSQTKLANYCFRNKGDLTFENVSVEYGFTEEASSNGAVYSDLDNDGDLDLVVNNIGERAMVYRNNSELDTTNNYLRVKLKSGDRNRNAIGAKVWVYRSSSPTLVAEQFPVRGFLSSVEPVLHFGLGNVQDVVKIIVQWPDGKKCEYLNIPVNTEVLLEPKPTGITGNKEKDNNTLFTDITTIAGINFLQEENAYVDFKHEFLLPWQLSRQGPRLAKADVNLDGLEDVFIGAPIGQSSRLYLQQANETFKLSHTQPWEADSLSEDIQPAFFDADTDGDADLYVVSGGNELNVDAPQLQDRLYLNDGKGNFRTSVKALPVMRSSKSCVAVADYNKDGRPDLFVGGRTVPGKYGEIPVSYLLRNESVGKEARFKDACDADAPQLRFAGMVTDASWTDLNNDGWPDLVLVGEWMPVKIFINSKGRLVEKTTEYGMTKSGGLWTRIIPADLDGDGDKDFLLGNLAPNSQLRASSEEPMTLCVNDFYRNGTLLPIVNYYIQGVSYPYASRDELTEPLPALKKKFLKYAPYATATMSDIFTAEEREGLKEYAVHTTRNAWLENDKNHRLILRELPVEAQFSAIQCAVEVDNGGKHNFFAAGNFYPFRVQLGREDASKGVWLISGGAGIIKAAPQPAGAGAVDGDVRDMVRIKSAQGNEIIIVARNNDLVKVLKVNKQ